MRYAICMQYDVIIGLEIHAELKTKSKMFCSCDNDAEKKEPNTAVCPICMAHPGALPAPNKKAIEWTILTGLALNGKISKKSKFDRKNYFYPDLPKGYQISQYDRPLVYGGFLRVDDFEIGITRVHLEEDTGKLTHPQRKDYSLVDYNRAGTPLLELVTEPVIPDAKTAKKFCRVFQQILRYLRVSDADMEKGQMRCEANISLQEKEKWEYVKGEGIMPIGDYRLNPKVEIKNINSFRAVEKAINYEINRQNEALGIKEPVIQETRGWDENRAITVSQRTKETSADYRYFPEPDIPPLAINDKIVQKIRSKLIELPPAKKQRFMDQYFFDPETADILVGDKDLADYTERVISELREWINSTGDDWERQKKKLAKISSNWLISELFMHLKKDNTTMNDVKFTPENFAELISLVYQNKINSTAGRKILAFMYLYGGDPTDIMRDLGLEQIDDEKQLVNIVKRVLNNNPDQVKQYKAGKETIFKFLVGKTMAETGGKANPQKVQEILKVLLTK